MRIFKRGLPQRFGSCFENCFMVAVRVTARDGTRANTKLSMLDVATPKQAGRMLLGWSGTDVGKPTWMLPEARLPKFSVIIFLNCLTWLTPGDGDGMLAGMAKHKYGP